jgi:hypothetical protein
MGSAYSQIAIAKGKAAMNMLERNNMANLLRLREQECEQEEEEIRYLEQALVAAQLRDADHET